ncbi:hypothetical protein CLPUN_19700 [Clostridium puniceum]|uniref:Pentapeptide repeat protein n=1 Tax=Clostridium puniceum TaxID=29367 RepID=A0A1S8TKV7_9CLOT|nr:hypothetical protein [Clostridium puniceum]OOM78361.1 hypothetical protein CLPUN_19700 [Clostridium puniceum]
MQKSFIYSLYDTFSLMEFCENKLKNEYEIKEVISKNYIIDKKVCSAFLKYISIKVKKYNNHDDFKTLSFGIKSNMDLYELIIPLTEYEACKKIKESFGNLSIETIWGILFGVLNIIDSFRLDVNPIVEEENWYYSKASNSKVMLSKPYFYNNLCYYAESLCYYDLVTAYLSATSQSPIGGMQSLETFDVEKVLVGEQQYFQIVIPNTHLTYIEFLEKVFTNEVLIKYIQEYYKSKNLSLKKIEAGLQIILFYFQQLKSPVKEKCNTKTNLEKIINQNNSYSDIILEEGKIFAGIYENCIFQNIDFSEISIEAEFLRCKFINCNFRNSHWGEYGDRRIPLLELEFINCSHLPKDIYFLEMLKRCNITQYHF